MHQRRFWSKNRDWVRPRKRPRKTEFNAAKGIYEPVELEEDVVKTIITLLWYSRIPVFRERERIPYCPHCHEKVGRASDEGRVESESQKEFVRRARRDGVLAFFAYSWSDVWWNFWAIGIELPEG